MAELKRKILVVDDEEGIRNVIKEYLTAKGYLIDEAEDGIIAEEKTKNTRYDLIIMDIMMPNQDGFATVKHIKEQDAVVPIIMLSAKQETSDKLEGFEYGIDDYITKPFELKELIARVKAVLNRTSNSFQNNKIIQINNLSIDIENRIVKINDNEVLLTPKEYELLFYFVNNKGKALSREQLLKDVWGYNGPCIDDRTIDTHVKMLRNHLGPEYRDIIITLRRLGYRCQY